MASNNLTDFDRFKVVCFKTVYKAQKSLSCVDRLVYAILETSDDKVCLDNPLVKNTFEKWLAEFGTKKSTNLRSRKDGSEKAVQNGSRQDQNIPVRQDTSDPGL